MLSLGRTKVKDVLYCSACVLDDEVIVLVVYCAALGKHPVAAGSENVVYACEREEVFAVETAGYDPLNLPKGPPWY